MKYPWAPKSQMSYNSPPPTLYVSYNGHTVAELKRVDGKYAFSYRDEFHALNLSTIPGLPHSMGETLHDELPLFFKERLPDLRRPEIRRWLQLHPKVDRDDDLQLLGALGSHSITDSFVLSKVAA